MYILERKINYFFKKLNFNKTAYIQLIKVIIFSHLLWKFMQHIIQLKLHLLFTVKIKKIKQFTKKIQLELILLI